ncbi:hypothetical protein FCL40_03770 [Ferrimonas sediminicola]|uniref:Uncharacterized protein n=1 Tax=Ferrimonas sediminicola TaxID=2569538 RepID=A0A4U1BJK1_9GAMM|nr:hypothetical protein [Ferrimonas sediminicola]TKB50290.1 hypothetical protein FCL40_03770 [Ferrimonas sediminicola]
MSVDAVAFVGGLAFGCLFAFLLCIGMAVVGGRGRPAERSEENGPLRQHLAECRLRLTQAGEENRLLRRRIRELEVEVEPLRRPGGYYRGDPLDGAFRVKTVR